MRRTDPPIVDNNPNRHSSIHADRVLSIRSMLFDATETLAQRAVLKDRYQKTKDPESGGAMYADRPRTLVGMYRKLY